MEQLIKEMEAFAYLHKVRPGTVLQRAGGLGGGAWAKWTSGSTSCTMAMADRIRRYMATNWPEGVDLPAQLVPYLPKTDEDAA